MRFLLVDRITELESGKHASGLKNVTLSEDFFTHHFPQHPVMPGALIVECLVQLADWLIREHRGFEYAGLPASFESVKFHRLVHPGDQLQLKVEVVEAGDKSYRLRGNAHCEQQVVALTRFTMDLAPARELQPVEDAKIFFRLIRGLESRNH
jgi:3-hydroxyacyl-[acyl-carrier-protein] dehydratase